ncbi:helix-turn-helix domain-containing protein [Microbacterium sp. NPDC057659]|uniref:helix-turn-helix domain-containing protein n=1 Tax=Microbacterium sp. NPDC057659 TaxID=3346198 RepID=UPI00366B149B
MVDPTRGVLYPARLPEFHRLPSPPEITDLAVWFWIPEWDIQPGRSSRQDVVAYPALNLVVEPNGVSLVGATTRASHRDLTGRGWAVGALLKPAAVAALTDSPASVLDQEVPLAEPALHEAVAAAMASGDGHRERAVAVLSHWLRERAGEPADAARQANLAADLLMASDVRSPEEAAARLAVSVRTLQRLLHRHVGLPPAAMIRRRRLQEAAERVRTDPAVELATVAAEFGYADHAHLTTVFRSVLGFTPSAYRAASRP